MARAQAHPSPGGPGDRKGILYRLRRWSALTRYLDDGALPIDNNWVENRTRPIALGRDNCLFNRLRSRRSSRCCRDESHTERATQWRKRFGQLEALDVRRLRQLEHKRHAEAVSHERD
jgi:hypothetical protein